MVDAFDQLSTTNKKMLTDNFIVGASYGGANSCHPYSQTFSDGSYYKDDPTKLAKDLVDLCPELDKYYDFDIEQINDKFDECAEFLGETCKALKKLKPSCI